MSIINQYPQIRQSIILPDDVVQSPAADASGTLVSQITTTLTQDRPALIATQLPASEYLVIASITVNGANPPANAAVPTLVTSYSYDSPAGTADNTIAGTTSQGSDVVEGFDVSYSAEFFHNGQSVVSAGTIGGAYQANQTWSYTVTLSIYRQ